MISLSTAFKVHSDVTIVEKANSIAAPDQTSTIQLPREEATEKVQSNMPRLNVIKQYMEVKPGKLASVGKPLQSNHPVIYVKSSQQGEKVNVYFNQGDANSVTMAFGFLHKGNTFYPVVEGNKIKLREITDMETDILDKRCLFQWNSKVGEWGILKSVAEPQKYLCIVKRKVTVGTRNQAATFRLK
ncbi:hypothetical protein J4Q44_G00229340 [Coregonus suidteri]|uniref:Uncharacterized protein n=1 Tax=Coregonus suidteri TaxID=861788 RepID=A0AAN8L5D9_9TELE